MKNLNFQTKHYMENFVVYQSMIVEIFSYLEKKRTPIFVFKSSLKVNIITTIIIIIIVVVVVVVFSLHLFHANLPNGKLAYFYPLSFISCFLSRKQQQQIQAHQDDEKKENALESICREREFKMKIKTFSHSNNTSRLLSFIYTQVDKQCYSRERRRRISGSEIAPVVVT